jgi:hypothetical protein
VVIVRSYSRSFALKNPITIRITPHRLSKSGQRYAAYWNERLLCTSKNPFLTAARALLRQGEAPDTVLLMKHKGSPHISLMSTVGKAARLTIRETAREGPIFVGFSSPLNGPQFTPRHDRISRSVALRTLTPSSLSPVS